MPFCPAVCSTDRQTDSQAQHYCWQMISCSPRVFQRQFIQLVMHGTAHCSPAQPSRADPSRAEQSRAEQSRAEQSRAEQSRAQQSRAEQSRAELTGAAATFNMSELCSMLTASNEMQLNLVDLPLVCCDKMYSLLTGHIKDIRMMSESLPTMT